MTAEHFDEIHLKPDHVDHGCSRGEFAHEIAVAVWPIGAARH